jgi:hypothetical protein
MNKIKVKQTKCPRFKFKPREVTGGGGGGTVAESKFFCKNYSMSQVQTLKPKPFNKVMNTPTNSVEMIPSMLRTQQKKMGSIGHPVSKIWPKL